MNKQFVYPLLLLILSCGKGGNDDPGNNPGPNPNPGNGAPEMVDIQQILPDTGTRLQATITIKGKGFNPILVNNTVSLGNQIVPVKSASATELVVSVPADLPFGKNIIRVDVLTRNENHNISLSDIDITGFYMKDHIVTTIAGSGAGGSTDGDPMSATFQTPKGIAVDAAGNVYIADAAVHKIRKIGIDGKVSTVAGSGARGRADGNAGNASFFNPSSIAVDAAGTIYVADQFNNTIRKISNNTVSTIAGNGIAADVNGNGINASFNQPYGIAVDAQGNVYVGDYGNRKVKKITPAGDVTTVAGTGVSGSQDGPGNMATFGGPGGLAFDSKGNLIVCDKMGGKIRKITPAGNVSTIGGTISATNEPTAVTVDDQDNIYVCYRGLSRIRKYTPAGIESNFIGNGISTYHDGLFLEASFGEPEGLAAQKTADGKWVFYITDSFYKRIRKAGLQ